MSVIRSPRCAAGSFRPRSRWATPILVVCGLVASVMLAGCAPEEAVEIDPANPPIDLTGITHSFPPSDEMKAAAAQQCLDDPTLETGFIRAVDPNTGDEVSSYSVPCADITADGSSDSPADGTSNGNAASPSDSG